MPGVCNAKSRCPKKGHDFAPMHAWQSTKEKKSELGTATGIITHAANAAMNCTSAGVVNASPDEKFDLMRFRKETETPP
jgi:hypothetical protein